MLFLLYILLFIFNINKYIQSQPLSKNELDSIPNRINRWNRLDNNIKNEINILTSIANDARYPLIHQIKTEYSLILIKRESNELELDWYTNGKRFRKSIQRAVIVYDKIIEKETEIRNRLSTDEYNSRHNYLVQVKMLLKETSSYLNLKENSDITRLIDTMREYLNKKINWTSFFVNNKISIMYNLEFPYPFFDRNIYKNTPSTSAEPTSSNSLNNNGKRPLDMSTANRYLRNKKRHHSLSPQLSTNMNPNRLQLQNHDTFIGTSNGHYRINRNNNFVINEPSSDNSPRSISNRPFSPNQVSTQYRNIPNEDELHTPTSRSQSINNNRNGENTSEIRTNQLNLNQNDSPQTPTGASIVFPLNAINTPQRQRITRPERPNFSNLISNGLRTRLNFDRGDAPITDPSITYNNFIQEMAYKNSEVKQWTLPNNHLYDHVSLNHKVNNDDLCPICHNTFVSGSVQVLTPCKHLFHSECLHQSFISVGYFCPICRSSVDIRSS